MALLDEVIVCTFQQSVYYLTKVGLCFCDITSHLFPRNTAVVTSLLIGASILSFFWLLFSFVFPMVTS